MLDEEPPSEVGSPIPANVQHAISVTLPTWASNVGYEEGADWVVSKMQCGYPRFFIGKNIQKLAERCVIRFGIPGESGMLFPSLKCAQRCRDFLISKTKPEPKIRIVEVRDIAPSLAHDMGGTLCVVLFEVSLSSLAKQYWQHTGEGISSRLADYFLRQSDHSTAIANLPDGSEDAHIDFTKKNQNHNRHYSRKPSIDIPVARSASSSTAGDAETLNRDQLIYLEERYGRNLNIKAVRQAKIAVRRRIAGSLLLDSDLDMAIQTSELAQLEPFAGKEHKRVPEDDVYLYPTGMTSIFHSHQLAMRTLDNGDRRLSSCFGFPYTDTLKIIQKWGPGAIFFGRGDESDMSELVSKLEAGEQLLALFCECPSNPLLRTPPLRKLRTLADKYKFLLIVDETIGNPINIRVLPFADIIVSSLTKVFSGDSNVMGGSLILNPKGPYYNDLKRTIEATYEDNLWVEDAVTLERNSRDFVARIARINENAELLCDILQQSKYIKNIFYPKFGPTSENYEAIRTEGGGYGGLLSVIFDTIEEAAAFYDALATAKGPSLGTNFTLSSPYTLLAHFTELSWAQEFGVETSLVRISVGLESRECLERIFTKALQALENHCRMKKSSEGQ